MKKILSFAICLILLAVMVIPVMAAGGYPKIVDEAGLLTYDQVSILEDMAQDLVDRYGIDVVILTVDDHYGDITTFADDYFDDNGYGVGNDASGVLFVLSMEDRDYAFSTCGDAIPALTDYGMDQLFDEISDELADDCFYDAFYEYLDQLDYYFQCYEDGEPVDRTVSVLDIIMKIGFALAIGLIVAGLIVGVMCGSMNTTRRQKGAQSYVSPGSYDLYHMHDAFLYSNVTKVRKQSSSSSGGSSTHRSSSGRTHGGSRGKF
ncbi:MAG: TPM domain-containing protein [Oscillospiraceae bacterium]|nr:TPM domain-containing protein [Oscillospiraceae bacterium]